MKKRYKLIIGILLLWILLFSLSEAASNYQRYLEETRTSGISQKIESDLTSMQLKGLNNYLKLIIPLISRDPDLLTSYELMVNLPDIPRRSWLKEMSLAL